MPKQDIFPDRRQAFGDSTISTDLLGPWRAADRKARAVEIAVCDESLKALEGQAEAPAASKREQARRLRGRANELLKAALAEIDARFKALRRGKPGA